MEGIRGCWVDCIGGEDGEDEDERIDPGMSEGKVFPSPEVGAGLSSFGARAGDFAL